MWLKKTGITEVKLLLDGDQKEKCEGPYKLKSLYLKDCSKAEEDICFKTNGLL